MPSDRMTPTTKLRFVERDCYVKNGESFKQPFKQRVLQQWWEDQGVMLTSLNHDPHGRPFVKYKGEWRDIPLEDEDAQ